MDPNKTLEEGRAAVAAYKKGIYPDIDNLMSAMIAFRDLDEWLTNGGFLPDVWSAQAKHDNKFVLKKEEI